MWLTLQKRYDCVYFHHLWKASVNVLLQQTSLLTLTKLWVKIQKFRVSTAILSKWCPGFHGNDVNYILGHELVVLFVKVIQLYTHAHREQYAIDINKGMTMTRKWTKTKGLLPRWPSALKLSSPSRTWTGSHDTLEVNKVVIVHLLTMWKKNVWLWCEERAGVF